MITSIERNCRLIGYKRIFRYADSFSWTLNVIAFIAAIGAGVVLPLMDIVFGKFVTTFNNFAVGRASVDEFRRALNDLT